MGRFLVTGALVTGVTAFRAEETQQAVELDPAGAVPKEFLMPRQVPQSSATGADVKVKVLVLMRMNKETDKAVTAIAMAANMNRYLSINVEGSVSEEDPWAIYVKKYADGDNKGMVDVIVEETFTNEETKKKHDGGAKPGLGLAVATWKALTGAPLLQPHTMSVARDSGNEQNGWEVMGFLNALKSAGSEKVTLDFRTQGEQEQEEVKQVEAAGFKKIPLEKAQAGFDAAVQHALMGSQGWLGDGHIGRAVSKVGRFFSNINQRGSIIYQGGLDLWKARQVLRKEKKAAELAASAKMPEAKTMDKEETG